MTTKTIIPQHSFTEGIQLPGLLSAGALATDSSGNVIAGSSSSVPLDIPAGNTFVIAYNTQVQMSRGMKVEGGIVNNGGGLLGGT